MIQQLSLSFLMQQLPLPSADPLLATLPAGAGQPEGKDADTDFSGWMEAEDHPNVDMPTADPLVVLSQVPMLLAQPPSQPAPAEPLQPDTTTAAAINHTVPPQEVAGPQQLGLPMRPIAPAPEALSPATDPPVSRLPLKAKPNLPLHDLSHPPVQTTAQVGPSDDIAVFPADFIASPDPAQVHADRAAPAKMPETSAVQMADTTPIPAATSANMQRADIAPNQKIARPSAQIAKSVAPQPAVRAPANTTEQPSGPQAANSLPQPQQAAQTAAEATPPAADVTTNLVALAKPETRVTPPVSPQVATAATETVALAAKVVVPVQKPQAATARSTAPTPHWSRIDTKTEAASPAVEPATLPVPQATPVDQAVLAQAGQSDDIRAIPPRPPNLPQSDVPPMHRPAAMPANLHSQLLTHVPSALQKQVEVLLAPEELGHVKFQIRHIGDSVSVFLSAERPETMDMLRRNGEDLLREFRQAGFSGASLDFGQWGQQQKPSQQPPAAFALPDEFSLAPPIARPAPTLVSAGQAQGLNIRL